MRKIVSKLQKKFMAPEKPLISRMVVGGGVFEGFDFIWISLNDIFLEEEPNT